MLLARAMEYGDYLITPPCDLSPSGLWLLVPLSRRLVEEIECTGEDLPEDDELDEMDGLDEPSDGTEGYQSPADSGAPDWSPWMLLPSEVVR